MGQGKPVGFLAIDLPYNFEKYSEKFNYYMSRLDRTIVPLTGGKMILVVISLDSYPELRKVYDLNTEKYGVYMFAKKNKKVYKMEESCMRDMNNIELRPIERFVRGVIDNRISPIKKSEIADGLE